MALWSAMVLPALLGLLALNIMAQAEEPLPTSLFLVKSRGANISVPVFWFLLRHNGELLVDKWHFVCAASIQ